ncbi:molybdenum cofactor biosynthesis protein MoaE [Thiopseudomonas alkaliphila]|uniref:molybdopterin synthase catalytic subunit MoaE n=1 Tax=Thiopseudomonas alkaliphila TaxID=1697053 RepID=UPI00069E8D70|nr:molybdopterin synthase catalytic subunit MoaE [Thiopseudomonas alkaliphila]AKX45235.1 molybdenum cofactor biosynthesis protein MoaE [Thiopseudomonas alkaliphila]AKX47223.1 molybdenum cofactor biosynthesis protein MoaE [Thiopseudomonas alkaliphila]AKX48553.1 molybdenum cofactor biosynthesis protein MoaE [Thiopseudomonas alkaliphila]AKX53677.1 molybdenum cofactor biosynthesis protein MoaE [Thiopseudomonas alkaliphila]AKX55361.1 molybdenum cofactor biosynthesis protein MoaE [Thiopseudomonas al
MQISVQTDAFDAGQLLNQMQAKQLGIGAVASFVGYVRDYNQDAAVSELLLEHYPGMTEKALEKIVEQAEQRWPLLRVKVVHRVGLLGLGEPIVFVAVASAHRQAAFAACEFIMDYLKTRAPFWKKEHTEQGARWVDGRDSDQQAAARWTEKSSC